MLAGMTSYEGIVDYGKERGGEFLRLLGFTRAAQPLQGHLFASLSAN